MQSRAAFWRGREGEQLMQDHLGTKSLKREQEKVPRRLLEASFNT